MAGSNLTQPVTSQECNYSAPTCSGFTYTPWSACNDNGVQARNVLTSSPANCTGGSPVLFQKCTYTPPCTGFTYKPWSACQSNGLQYRDILTKTPYNCSGGSPVLTQNCTYDPGSNTGATTGTAPAVGSNLCVISPAGGNYFDPVEITVRCGSNVTGSTWQWGKYGTPTSFSGNTVVTYPADKTNILYVKYTYRVVAGTKSYTKTGNSYRTFTANQNYCKLTPDSGTYANDTSITITCGRTVKGGTYQWDNGTTTNFTSPATISYVADRNKKLKVTFTYTYSSALGTGALEKTAVFNKFYYLKRCTDSENGYASQLKGDLVFTQNITTKNYTDTCVGNYVTDYYCGADKTVKTAKILCPYGCSNGACNLPATTY
jgi:hypothetical protein